MSNDHGVAIPVIAGLAAGIALIALFSMLLKPSFSMSDDEVRSKVRNLPEVQAFYERYTPLEQIRREGTTTYVEYSIGRTWYREHGDPGNGVIDMSKVLKLTVMVDSFGRTSLLFECGGPMSVSGPASVEAIRTTECIENP